MSQGLLQSALKKLVLPRAGFTRRTVATALACAR